MVFLSHSNTYKKDIQIVELDLKLIKKQIEFEYDSLILFGSEAREDSNQYSDIDILIVAKRKHQSFSFKKANFTVYTIETLHKMASEGSLFIHHLITEAKVIEGFDYMKTLKENFISKLNYTNYRDKIISCFNLLDIDETGYYELDSKPFTLLRYLIRSYLYSLAYDNKFRGYNINEITDKLGYKTLDYIFQYRENSNPSFKKFLKAKFDIENSLRIKINNPCNNLETLIFNYYSENQLLVILGLRLLRNGEFRLNYEGIYETEP